VLPSGAEPIEEEELNRQDAKDAKFRKREGTDFLLNRQVTRIAKGFREARVERLSPLPSL
jgi:hypothetical protein